MNVPLLPPKQPAETRTLTFNFFEEMAVGDVLVSATSVTGDPAGLTLSSGVTESPLVTCQVGGGTDGERYMVTCRVTTQQGDLLELSAMIDVREPVPWGADTLIPTSLTELEDPLMAQIGPLTTDVLDPLLIAAVGIFNAVPVTGIFTLTDLELDRVATPLEQRILVLLAARAYIDQKLVQAALNAIVHVNPAGRTELDRIPEALMLARKALTDQIDEALTGLNAAGVVNEIAVTELGETKDTYRTGAPWPLIGPAI